MDPLQGRSAVLDAQLSLLEHVSVETLLDASAWLTPTTYADVVTERVVSSLCGYPPCPNTLRRARGGGEDAQYCSAACAHHSATYKASLLDEPPALLAGAGPPPVPPAPPATADDGADAAGGAVAHVSDAVIADVVVERHARPAGLPPSPPPRAATGAGAASAASAGGDGYVYDDDDGPVSAADAAIAASLGIPLDSSSDEDGEGGESEDGPVYASHYALPVAGGPPPTRPDLASAPARAWAGLAARVTTATRAMLSTDDGGQEQGPAPVSPGMERFTAQTVARLPAVLRDVGAQDAAAIDDVDALAAQLQSLCTTLRCDGSGDDDDGAGELHVYTLVRALASAPGARGAGARAALRGAGAAGEQAALARWGASAADLDACLALFS